jgi:hypothetical protein
MESIINNMTSVDRDRFGKMVTGFRDHSSRSLGVMEAIPDKFAAIIGKGPFGYDMNIDSFKNSTRGHITEYNVLLGKMGGPKSYTQRELKSFATGYAKGTIPGNVKSFL